MHRKHFLVNNLLVIGNTHLKTAHPFAQSIPILYLRGAIQKKQHQPDETIKVEVRLEDETVWLTQAQIVELFQSSKANVSEHIKLEISPIII